MSRLQVLKYFGLVGLWLGVFFLLTEFFYLPLISDLLTYGAVIWLTVFIASFFSASTKRFHDFGIPAFVPALLIVVAAVIWWRGFGDDVLLQREQAALFRNMDREAPKVYGEALSQEALQQAVNDMSAEDFARISADVDNEIRSITILVFGGAVVLVLLSIMPGRDGANRFGPDPREKIS